MYSIQTTTATPNFFQLRIQAMLNHSFGTQKEELDLFYTYWASKGEYVTRTTLENLPAEAEEILDYMETLVNIRFGGRSYVRHLYPDADNNPQAAFSFSSRSMVFHTTKGAARQVKALAKKIAAKFPATEEITLLTFTAAQSPSSPLNYVTNVMRKTDAVLPLPSFYPWLEMSIDDYAKEFMASPSNILLMYGPPGTGKSSFIRAMLFALKTQVGQAYDQSLVKVPFFFVKSQALCDVLILEDCDHLLMPRDSGNENLHILLNSTDGVINKKGSGKVIISTNLTSLTKIDTAVTRPGRCFDTLNFRELNTKEACVVCDDLNLKDKNVDEQGKWTLAELIARHPREQAIKKGKVGFI